MRPGRVFGGRLQRGVAAGLAVAALAGGFAAAEIVVAQSDEKADVDAKLNRAEERLRAARDRESVVTREVEGYTSRIRVLEGRLAPLRARSERLDGELAVLRQRLADLTRRLTVERRRLAEAEDILNRRRVVLAERLTDLYVRGEPDPFLILFSSGSLNDAAEAADVLELVVDQDRNLVESVREHRNEVKRTRDRIASVRAEVAEAEARAEVAARQARAAKAALETQKAGLDKLLTGRQRVLTRVRGDRQQIEAEARNLRERSARLAAQIVAAQGGSAAGPSGFVSGGTPSAAGFIWPVHGTLTSGFGPRWGRMHEGIDISAGSGTPIAAAASGTVILAGWNGGYGQLVVVDHGGGLSTAYAHLSSIAVSVGQPVGQGTVVGGMGTTGHSTGVHLHFEVRVNGGAVNPIGYL